MNIDNLIFEPLVSFNSNGNEIQRCATVYKGIQIMWQTIFFWNIFKSPEDSFYVDRIMPENIKIENGSVVNIYEENGFGTPVFKSLESAIKFIDSIKTSPIKS